jgi:hypothetical protein
LGLDNDFKATINDKVYKSCLRGSQKVVATNRLPEVFQLCEGPKFVGVEATLGWVVV